MDYYMKGGKQFVHFREVVHSSEVSLYFISSQLTAVRLYDCSMLQTEVLAGGKEEGEHRLNSSSAHSLLSSTTSTSESYYVLLVTCLLTHWKIRNHVCINNIHTFLFTSNISLLQCIRA